MSYSKARDFYYRGDYYYEDSSPQFNEVVGILNNGGMSGGTGSTGVTCKSCVEKDMIKSKKDPKYWGSRYWFVLHNASINYPIKASLTEKERMKGFILGIPVTLPCEKCKPHAQAYIMKNTEFLDIICDGRNNLFKFFVDFHNTVNYRLGKPILTYDQAYKLYN